MFIYSNLKVEDEKFEHASYKVESCFANERKAASAEIQSQIDKCPMIIFNFNYLNTYLFVISFQQHLLLFFRK